MTTPSVAVPDVASAAGLRLLIVASVVFAALSTWMNFASAGFLEADGVTHYLYSRFAFESPAYFVDVWARPVRMLVHAVPAALFGLHGARAASLACALALAWLTYATARRLEWRLPALAGVFVLAQPLLFLHSFSELTELPFALLAAASFYALLSRRWWAFALLCGLLPASRPEGAAFVLLAFVMLLLHRRWYWLPLVVLPVVLWNHLGWWLWGSDAGPWQRWLIDRFPYSSKSLYAAGPIWRFLAVLPAVVSPLILPAVLLGTIGIAAIRSSRFTTGLGRFALPDEWLIVLIPWGFLAVHTWLHFTGRMSSSGEPRYLLATSPFWALLACRGWTMLADRFALKRPLRIAWMASLAPVLAQAAYPVLPLVPQPDAQLCRAIAAWYASSPQLRTNYPRVVATHPLLYYYFDQKIEGITREFARSAPPGTLFVFDSLYASYNSDASRVVTPELFEAAGWRRAPVEFALPGQSWIVFLSPAEAEKSGRQ